MTDKSALRAHYLELMKRQGREAQLAKSSVIARKLLENPVFQKARTVLFYASMPGEVDTLAMIHEAINLKKITALPIVDTKNKDLIPTVFTTMDDLRAGTYGILEPHGTRLDPIQLDAVIVPGLAFDRANNRLGRGAGYYDRFLSRLPKTTRTIGLAYDFQVVDRLPVEGHDTPLDDIIAA